MLVSRCWFTRRLRPERCRPSHSDCASTGSKCEPMIEPPLGLPMHCRPPKQDWSTEYLGPTISIAVVDSLEQAVEHINRYGSHHTDAIVTEDLRAADAFTTLVDSSAVMVNASTRFNDGGVFGLGAEIGISTDKFHAPRPVRAARIDDIQIHRSWRWAG